MSTPHETEGLETTDINSNNSDNPEKNAEQLARKSKEDLGQEVYSNIMREISNDSTAKDVSHENLGLLLFMTQKAISDLKQLKSIFYHRKFTNQSQS